MVRSGPFLVLWLLLAAGPGCLETREPVLDGTAGLVIHANVSAISAGGGTLETPGESHCPAGGGIDREGGVAHLRDQPDGPPPQLVVQVHFNGFRPGYVDGAFWTSVRWFEIQDASAGWTFRGAFDGRPLFLVDVRDGRLFLDGRPLEPGSTESVSFPHEVHLNGVPFYASTDLKIEYLEDLKVEYLRPLEPLAPSFGFLCV